MYFVMDKQVLSREYLAAIESIEERSREEKTATNQQQPKPRSRLGEQSPAALSLFATHGPARYHHVRLG
ncbi:MAG: hypothetical protein ACLPT4_04145 [Verrucomicrobiia bacterium]